jgi:hypothetical protein
MYSKRCLKITCSFAESAIFPSDMFPKPGPKIKPVIASPPLRWKVQYSEEFLPRDTCNHGFGPIVSTLRFCQSEDSRSGRKIGIDDPYQLWEAAGNG